jgi:F-type H+-transporting ATPase subunit delta
MAKVIDQQLAEVLYQLTNQAKDKELAGLLEQFANYLVSSGQIQRWPVIADLYRQKWLRRQGVLEVEIIHARPLDQDYLQGLIDELTKLLSASQLIVKTKLDPEILGGMIIRLPDRLLDASYRRQLRNLQANLL